MTLSNQNNIVTPVGMEELAPSVYEPYLSPYLVTGYKNEVSKFNKIYINSDKIFAYITMQNPEIDADGSFHLSSLTAIIYVQQMVIIHGCWYARLETKAGEAYLRDMRIRCQKAIRQSENIPFELHIPKIKRVKNMLLYNQIEFKVGEGNFWGTIKETVSVRTE
jgi:hypothetical protein